MENKLALCINLYACVIGIFFKQTNYHHLRYVLESTTIRGRWFSQQSATKYKTIDKQAHNVSYIVSHPYGRQKRNDSKKKYIDYNHSLCHRHV